MFAVNLKTRKISKFECKQNFNKKSGHTLTPINGNRIIEYGGFSYVKTKRIDISDILVYDMNPFF